MSKTFNALLVTDFNAGNLAASFASDPLRPTVRASPAPFGHADSILLNEHNEVWQSPFDFIVVWTRPETTISSCGRFAAFEQVDRREILAEVDAFAASVIQASKRTKRTFVVTWELPPFHPSHGSLDLSPTVGLSRLVLEMNLRLMQALDSRPGIVMLNCRKWLQLSGERAFNHRMWYLGKVPYSNDVFKASVTDIKAALRNLSGGTRKLLIVDLDDTLWGGTVGDVGWQNLQLGGHDPSGEALVDFQRELKALRRRGVVLAIASKNDEATAIRALDSHPEMVLRAQDFAAWRINWNDKAKNIVDIAADLHLGVDSAVFIDDNPVERARVREALPTVLVPEWPKDKRMYREALLMLDCFDSDVVTAEDRSRVESYAAEKQRIADRDGAKSFEEWLASLGTTVLVEPITALNRARVVQLLNKTNQMNLRTRRFTEASLLEWLAMPNASMYAFRVRDRFGDAGLTGVASVTVDGGRAELQDFVLSCRVMGRQVEETMLRFLCESSRDRSAGELVAVLEPTERNQPCLVLFRRSGFSETAVHCFVWPLSESYPLSKHVELVVDDAIWPVSPRA